MTDSISTHNRPQNTVVPTDSRTSTPAAGKQSSTASTNSGGQSSPSTIVELSNSGLLQDIGEKIGQLSEVNEARVASIKQSLAQGDYKIDADVIARKFSEIEKLLP